MATRNLIWEAHLLWLLPLLMMCWCLAALCRWAVKGGATGVGRILWTLAFTLAVLCWPAAFLAGIFSGGSRSTRTHSTQLPPDPPPVPIDPMRR